MPNYRKIATAVLLQFAIASCAAVDNKKAVKSINISAPTRNSFTPLSEITDTVHISWATTIGLMRWFRHDRPIGIYATLDGNEYLSTFCTGLNDCNENRIESIQQCQNMFRRKCYELGRFGKLSKKNVVAPVAEPETILMGFSWPDDENEYLITEGKYFTRAPSGNLITPWVFKGRGCSLEIDNEMTTFHAQCGGGDNFSGSFVKHAENYYTGSGRSENGLALVLDMTGPNFLKTRNVQFAKGPIRRRRTNPDPENDDEIRKLSDIELCGYSLDSTSGTAKWGTQDYLSHYVSEAKRRGLRASDCPK
ncbi:MAG: hypothetical protein HQ483_04445 [Rhodospirillales bacterium]|nr:hypothetical protein [Rhodospirillales bacterium]